MDTLKSLGCTKDGVVKVRTYKVFTAEERVMAFMDKIHVAEDGCWNWTGATFVQGYGALGIGGAKVKAHRFSYESFIGPIPAGMGVLHKCDNKKCVNPEHLEAGSQAKNVRDAYDRGLMPKRCGEQINTAKLTADAVAEIRATERRRGYRQYLANKFGVSEATISDVVCGRSWGHVAHPRQAREWGWLK